MLVLAMGLFLAFALPLVGSGKLVPLLLNLPSLFGLSLFKRPLLLLLLFCANHTLIVRACLVMAPLTSCLRGWHVLLNNLVLECTLSVSDVALRNILRCQLFDRLIIVIHLALLVVLRRKCTILIVTMDVLPLNDLPDIEQLDRVVNAVLDLDIVLSDLLHVDLEHLKELVWDVQFMLNSRQESVLKHDIFH